MRTICYSVKNIGDYILALSLLIIFSPLLIIISLLIKMDSKGPVIYKQSRIGKGKKVFQIYKFRTMIVGAEFQGSGFGIMKNDSRITRLGKILRRTNIDEFPQLINILKGEMSFVGPRPGLPYQIERYNEYQLQRLKAKPGITGLAQVMGRGMIPWSKRIEYDINYINNWSICLDIRILFKTFTNLFSNAAYIEEQDPKIIEDFDT